MSSSLKKTITTGGALEMSQPTCTCGEVLVNDVKATPTSVRSNESQYHNLFACCMSANDKSN
jgi:hypothetical protein